MKTEEYLLQHVELTQKRVEAHERHLNLLFKEVDLISKSVFETFDTFIDLFKNVFSVSFTGYIALKVVDPKWVSLNFETQDKILNILIVSGILICFAVFFRYIALNRVKKQSDERIATIKGLLEAEVGCISGIIEMHQKLFKDNH
jgi:uncharacterized protein YoxC